MLLKYIRCPCSACLKENNFNLSFILSLLFVRQFRCTQRARIHEWKFLLGVTGARLKIIMKITGHSRLGFPVNHWFYEGGRVWKGHKILSSLFFFFCLGQERKDFFCIEGRLEKWENSLSKEQQGNNQLVTFMLLVWSVYCWTGEFYPLSTVW